MGRRFVPKSLVGRVPLPRYRKRSGSLPTPALLTKAGFAVRSRYEVICANYLHAHHIRMQYEPLILIGGRQYRPDFYLPDMDLFLEICGYGHMPHYRVRTRTKKSAYAAAGLNAVFVHYRGRGSLKDAIKDALVIKGINLDDA